MTSNYEAGDIEGLPVHKKQKPTLNEAADVALEIWEEHLKTLGPSDRQKAVAKFYTGQTTRRGIPARSQRPRRTSQKSR